MVNPYKPPASAVLKNDKDRDGFYRKRKYIITTANSEWPMRCIKCNSDTSRFKRLTLSYVNPWFYLTILISILITLVLVLIFQKKFRFEIPLCDKHIKKRRNMVISHWLLLLTSLVLLGLSISFEMDILMMIAIFVFVILLFSALINRLAYIAKYKKGKIWIVGARKPFLDSLQELEWFTMK